jgi:lysozyme
MRLVTLDGCACPRPLYPLLKKLQKETGCTYNSIYRGDDAAAILHRHGKHTQRELYDGYARGLPGYYPANPPTMGTHILKGDGTVGRIGQKLPWWRCGIDVNDSDVPRLIAAAKKHGWTLYQPYASGSEYHHLNFRYKPSRWRAFFKHVFGPKKPVTKAHPVHTGGIEAVGPARVVPKETIIKPVKKPTKKLPKKPTHLSKKGAEFIASFEGFRADAYWDAYGKVWTIGYGTAHGVKKGDHVTKSEALGLLQKDAASAVKAINDLVKVPLTQNQLDALVSFVYNLGAGALGESTLLKKLNKRDYKGAASEFPKWVYAGGVQLPGLVRRRKAEAALFLKK